MNKYAEFQRSEQLVRHLFDIPETLFYAIKRTLTDEEHDWLFSRNSYERKRAGLSWFLKEFPQFKITKDF